VNIHETNGRSVTEVLPSWGLQCAISIMPKAARPFAYNLIELLDGDVLNGPVWGDHPLQQPSLLLKRQADGLQRALEAGE
jgi:hypothetical protein